MKKIHVLILILSAGCNSMQTESKQTPSNDSITQRDSVVESVTSKVITKPLTNKNELLGTWQSEGKELLAVEINQDSIYYPEHFESHKYRTNGDSIFISYPDFIYAGIVYFMNDTLIIESEDGKLKYTRRNN